MMDDGFNVKNTEMPQILEHSGVTMKFHVSNDGADLELELNDRDGFIIGTRLQVGGVYSSFTTGTLRVPVSVGDEVSLYNRRQAGGGTWRGRVEIDTTSGTWRVNWETKD
jgi:hypothetical protein